MKTPRHQKRLHSRTRRKPYSQLNVGELAAATAEYDREDLSPPVALKGGKLDRYQHAMSRRGRPRVGKGSKAITVTLERDLLTDADRVARRKGISRSKLIALALKAQMHRTRSKS